MSDITGSDAVKTLSTFPGMAHIIYSYTFIYTYPTLCIHTHTHKTQIHIHTNFMHTNTHTHEYTITYTQIHIYTNRRAHKYMYTQIHVHSNHVHTNTRTHTNIHRHTNAPTHIHTHGPYTCAMHSYSLHVCSDLWSHITFWTVVGCAIVYFFAGILGVRVLRKGKLYFWIPFASACIGALLGFCSGAVSCKGISTITISQNFHSFRAKESRPERCVHFLPSPSQHHE